MQVLHSFNGSNRETLSSHGPFHVHALPSIARTIAVWVGGGGGGEMTGCFFVLENQALAFFLTKPAPRTLTLFSTGSNNGPGGSEASLGFFRSSPASMTLGAAAES